MFFLLLSGLFALSLSRIARYVPSLARQIASLKIQK